MSAGRTLARQRKIVQDALAVGEIAGKLKDRELDVNISFLKGALRTICEPDVVELVHLGKNAAVLPRYCCGGLLHKKISSAMMSMFTYSYH